eukprot:5790310-Amphidinium_carterae.2
MQRRRKELQQQVDGNIQLKEFKETRVYSMQLWSQTYSQHSYHRMQLPMDPAQQLMIMHPDNLWTPPAFEDPVMER